MCNNVMSVCLQIIVWITHASVRLPFRLAPQHMVCNVCMIVFYTDSSISWDYFTYVNIISFTFQVTERYNVHHIISIILKNGDDLRLRMSCIMVLLWKSEGYDFRWVSHSCTWLMCYYNLLFILISVISRDARERIQ